jgi:hypothetical protein
MALIPKIGGLVTAPNAVSCAPPGSLAVAENVTQLFDGTLEPRRGFKQFGFSGSSGPTRCFEFPGQSGAMQIEGRAGASGFAAFYFDPDSGDQTEFLVLAGPDSMMDHPLKSDPRVRVDATAAQANLYFTSASGLWAASGGIFTAGATLFLQSRPVGLPRPPAPSVTLAATGSLLMATGQRRTYRVTLAYYDQKGNYTESAPSEPVAIDNTSGSNRTPQVVLRTPIGCPPGTFFRVWRSLEVAAGTQASDEMFLVQEFLNDNGGDANNFVFAGDSGYISDVSLDSLLNVPLYTNPLTGDGTGIAGENLRPPAGTCICSFRGRTIIGRPAFAHSLQIQIVGVGTGGVLPGDAITIDGVTYTATLTSGLEGSRQFYCGVSGTVPANIEACARSLVLAIYIANSGNSPLPPGAGSRNIISQLTARYASTGTNDFGRIVLERPFAWTPGYSADPPFMALPNGGGFRFPSGTQTSTDDYTPGGIAWSKADQPECFPAGFFQPVGDSGSAVLGFSVHKDAVFIYKEDGCWILRDNGTDQPSIDLLDASVICVAPDSIAVVDNAAFLLSQRGVLRISQDGTQDVSDPIDDQVITAQNRDQFNQALAFGIGYESYRLYILATPAGATEDACSYQWVLNVDLGTWTKWTIPGLLHGTTLPGRNRIMFCFVNQLMALYASSSFDASAFPPSAGSMVERRSGVSSTDYYDGYSTYANQPDPAGFTDPTQATFNTNKLFFRGDMFRFTGPGSKIYTPRLVSIDKNGVGTLDGIYPWSGGNQMEWFQRIPVRVRFLDITEGAPTVSKQISEIQYYFQFFDGDWLDVEIDSEQSGAGSGLLPVYPDPGVALNAQAIGGGPLGAQKRNVVLRASPAAAESRAVALGLEFQAPCALSRFTLNAVNIDASGGSKTGTR